MAARGRDPAVERDLEVALVEQAALPVDDRSGLVLGGLDLSRRHHLGKAARDLQGLAPGVDGHFELDDALVQLGRLVVAPAQRPDRADGCGRADQRAGSGEQREHG